MLIILYEVYFILQVQRKKFVDEGESLREQISKLEELLSSKKHILQVNYTIGFEFTLLQRSISEQSLLRLFRRFVRCTLQFYEPFLSCKRLFACVLLSVLALLFLIFHIFLSAYENAFINLNIMIRCARIKYHRSYGCILLFISLCSKCMNVPFLCICAIWYCSLKFAVGYYLLSINNVYLSLPSVLDFFKVIKEEATELKNKFSSPRRSELEDADDGQLEDIDVIPNEEMLLVQENTQNFREF